MELHITELKKCSQNKLAASLNFASSNYRNKDNKICEVSLVLRFSEAGTLTHTSCAAWGLCREVRQSGKYLLGICIFMRHNLFAMRFFHQLKIFGSLKVLPQTAISHIYILTP